MSSKKLDFQPSGFFALRTPLLSFDEIVRWTESGPDSEGLLRHVRSVLQRPEVREAIFLASPKLESNLDGWLAEPDTPESKKVLRSLIRYLTRMSSRPTPFGTFAGTGVGTIGDATDLRLAEVTAHRRKTRLDMQYLTAIAEASHDPSVIRSLKWYPNSSLYPAAGRLRFAEAHNEGGIRHYRLVAVDPSEGVVIVLERAAGGASFPELTDALVDDDISESDAAEFVGRLIDAQLLVSDLEPPVTGPEALESMLQTLTGSAQGGRIAAVLEETRTELDKIDASGLGSSPSLYRNLMGPLHALPAEVDPARLFQVDMVTATEAAQLGREVVNEIGRCIEALRSITSASDDDSLARFRADFLERYEGREVPLVEALDEEIGIGFAASRSPTAEASPLLAGLPFATPDAGGPSLGPRHRYLLRMLERAWVDGATELELDRAALDELAVARPVELPDAFAALCSVAPGGPGPVACLHGASGPSGAVLLGRFCLADPELEGAVSGHIESEEKLRPDALFAEIVHLPEGRVGNILARPVLRPFEIPFLGRSGATQDAQIAITDLMVSIVGDRVVLRSKQHDREVLPRLTSAHNYGLRGLGIYRFLCSLQAQNAAAGLLWHWGPFESARFLPRLVIGRVVVARARWLLDRADLDVFDKTREKFRLPRYVALQDADNELLVDLDNTLSIDTFLSLVSRRPSAQLVEMWPTPDRLCVTGPGGSFTNEVIVPFVRSPRETVTPSIRRVPDAERRFPPGSEWLYAKLYTGTATADKLLRELVGPFVRQQAGRGSIDSWFFLRYGDPAWHIRLRLHGDPDRLSAEVLPQLHHWSRSFLEDGALWRIQLDTYEREIERYGGPDAIPIAEEIFRIDSEAALSLLEQLPGDAWMDARWRVALLSIDRLLTDFGLDFDQRRTTVKNLRDGYAREFDASVELKRGIGQRFRDVRKDLANVLENKDSSIPSEAKAILDRRSNELTDPAGRLSALGDSLSIPHPEVVSSMAHMSVNRLLRSAHRAHELVIYDLLTRMYEGKAARNRES